MSQRKSHAGRRRHARQPAGHSQTPRSADGAELVSVNVERLAAGGDGIARLEDGRTLFVPLTAPGDRARVRVIEERPRFARGELVELLEPGLGRVEPRCAYFGRCGGCSWQHLEYSQQVAAKRSILRDALVRIGGFEVSEDLPFAASPRAYGYRQRARVLVERGRVGFRGRRSHELCATAGHCPVLQPALEAALTGWAERGGPARGAWIEERGEWEVSLGVDGARAVPLRSSASMDAAAVDMPLARDPLRVSPGVFAQANSLLLDEMVAAVCRAALGADPVLGVAESPASRVLELFAGAGSLTLTLARAAARVIAVDSNPAAAADLAANLNRAGLDNVEVRCEETDAVLGALTPLDHEIVVLDPPRSGLGQPGAERLAALHARRIVYLSCDPATLARDLRVLAGQGYELTRAEGFDLFPQTPHVEALAVMKFCGK